MLRREFLKTAATFSATTAMLLSDTLAAKSTKGKDARPNFLFIITDDQFMREWNVRPEGKTADGKPRNHTPNLDRLVAEGLYFNRMYATSSVCTPSRYSCLTGRFPSRCPQVQNKISKNHGYADVSFNTHIAAKETTAAKFLRHAGYFTGIVGKNHALDLKRPNIGADLEKKDPFSDEVTAWAKRRQGEVVKAIKTTQGFEFAENVYWGGTGVGMGDPFRHHNIDWTVEGALHFFDEAAKRDQPWYLYFSTTLTHGPTDTNEKGWQSRHTADPRISGEGMLKEPPKVAPYMQPRSTIAARIAKAGADPSTGDITWLDDAIGALLKKLEETNELDNTLVIMFSDNGMDRKGKNTGYDEGHNVPSVAWGNMVKHGITQSLAAGVDFVPTFLDMAKIPKEKWQSSVDGNSLASVLSNSKAKVQDSVYCEIGYARTVFTDEYIYLAVRHPDILDTERERKARFQMGWKGRKIPEGITWKSPYGHHGNFPGGPPPKEMGSGIIEQGPRPFYYDKDQLYDLKKDPRQKINLVRDPKYKAKTEEMKKILKSYLNKIPGKFGDLKTKIEITLE